MRIILLLATVSFPAPSVQAGAPVSDLSTAQRDIQRAEQSVEKAPGDLQAWNRLATAWFQRGLEIDQVEAYRRSEEAAREALRIDPKDVRAETERIQALLGQHEFETALEAAERLNLRNPDNVAVYGFIVDASLALGLYEKAEKACQWMLDLRPDQAEGLIRAARLRELYGDLEGASDFLNKAYFGLAPDQPQLQSLTLSDLARTLRLQGQTEEAERILERALRLTPGNPTALLELARTKQAQGKPNEAVELLSRRSRFSPGADRLFDLATALREAGRRDEAEEIFEEFERRAKAIQDQPFNANRQLIFRLAAASEGESEALRLAQSELTRRRDFDTLVALAWALHKRGSGDETRQEAEKPLSLRQRQILDSILRTLSEPDSESSFNFRFQIP